MTEHFGEHLMIDGYGGSYEKLNNKEEVFKVVTELVSKLDMHALSEPQVFFAAGNDIKDPGGWSAFVVIEESHISVHTFPARGFVSADVYTCKNGLDVETVKQYFTELFDLKDIEANFVLRGTRYPEGNIY
jgi:S-adenosylmethionine decarboxylase